MKLDSLKYYVSFIGWGRSGNSLVGALLDFHPNVYIKNEFSPIQERFETQEQIFNTIVKKLGIKRRKGTLQSWGGFNHARFKDMYSGVPLVLGNKKGGFTSNAMHKNPLHLPSGRVLNPCWGVFEKIYDEVIKIPVKWIHVQRNPYDNISRIHLKGDWDPDEAITVYFWQAESVKKLVEDVKRDSISVKLEDIIENTQKEVRSMCEHLEVPINIKHLEHCRSVVWKKPRKSRELVKWWTKERIKRVEDEMKKYPFMEGYSFNR